MTVIHSCVPNQPFWQMLGSWNTLVSSPAWINTYSSDLFHAFIYHKLIRTKYYFHFLQKQNKHLIRRCRYYFGFQVFGCWKKIETSLPPWSRLDHGSYLRNLYLPLHHPCHSPHITWLSSPTTTTNKIFNEKLISPININRGTRAH